MCSFSLFPYLLGVLRTSQAAGLFFLFLFSHLLELGILHCIYWFLSLRAKVFVLLIIIFVATGNRKAMQTVHWRKVN